MDETEELCIICSKQIGNDAASKLGRKGCDGINNASSKRDGTLTAQPGNYVHIKCRRLYCNAHNIKYDKINSNKEYIPESPRNLRSAETFNFKDQCLFCGHAAKLTRNKRGYDVYPVRTLDFQEEIHRVCDNRADFWADTVRNRLKTVNDLPAADAMYHQNCSVRFRTMKNSPTDQSELSNCKKPRGRPVLDHVKESFHSIVQYIEENDTELITIKDLIEMMKEQCEDEAFSDKHMKQKLVEHFGDSLTITEINGKINVVILKRTASSILHDFYMQQENEGGEAKKQKIIETAAKLIKCDIKAIDSDKSEYPSPADISSAQKNIEFLPESLQLFIRTIFSDRKSGIKTASIGQAIIQASRNRVVITPLLLSLGIQLHHQFASKFLIDTLYNLGFCASYTEVQKFESNAAVSQGTDIQGYVPGSFVQYVADNVDHNMRTLDGHGTFHGMGIITCVTPGTFAAVPIQRRNVDKEEICKAGEIKTAYYKPNEHVKPSVTLQDLQGVKYHDKTRKVDMLVKVTAPIRTQRPGWSGMMQMLHKGQFPGQTSITFLPMIDMDPSDLSCVYTTLKFVVDHAAKYEVKPILTFDQPLYWKAFNIVIGEPRDSPIKNIVLRLGGFYTIMSFLGSIGHLMQGSGLAEVLETIYAPNAVGHMLTGKSVSRALRGHFMVQNALMSLIVAETFALNISPEVSEDSDRTDIEDSIQEQPKKAVVDDSDLSAGSIISDVGRLYDGVMEGRLDISEVLRSELLDEAYEKIQNTKASLQNFRTATLWLQYLEMIDILQSFIKAERTGDWFLHLDAVAKMLPYFAASGHNLYLKSAYVYLQTMYNLQTSNTEVYDFFRSGYHVVRRSDRYWAGLSTDLVIEQVLMRSVKTNGGMTRGKGMGECQRAQWLLSLPSCAQFNKSMQDLTGVTYYTSDQHRECGQSRQARDGSDSQTVLKYLLERNPFSNDSKLRNIETGVEANQDVNVEQAACIGDKVVSSMVGENVMEHKFKKCHQATVLTCKPMSKLPGDDSVQVDPQLLFQRLVTAATRQSDDDISEVFQYELSSVPSTLFDVSGFPRQPQKATLADVIWSMGDCEGKESDEQKYVLDGGSLVHRVPWSPGACFSDICTAYTDYVAKHYKDAVVVFDGYMCGPSIKDVAHIRRSHGIASTNVDFKENTPFKGKKDKFLSNPDNKQKFINMLGDHLSKSGCTVLHANGDADVLIAKTAIVMAEKDKTVLIGEDTDLLVLLCHHAPDTCNIILRPGSRQCSSKSSKVWDIGKTKTVLGNTVCYSLPFLHAITGCDSTSKVLGIGKAKALKQLMTSDHLQTCAKVFLGNSDKQSVHAAGEKAMVTLFGGHEMESLDLLRFRKFARKVTVGLTCVQVQSIPPTSAATRYHSLRVYYQTQEWIEESDRLDALEWGWSLKNDMLFPIKTNLAPAPEHLLKIVKCNCKQNCDTKRCTCRKHGLECSVGCGECRGVQCSNRSGLVESDLLGDEEIDNDDICTQ